MNKFSFSKKGIVFYILAILLATSIFTSVGSALPQQENEDGCCIDNEELRNIMVTGYWNPTGQMIAQFSTDTDLNPQGWQGENWEDLGFNIYSYFPMPGTYTGDFEVDYQDTWEDFWRITDEIKPIAIISFGAGAGPWEIENIAVNRQSWVSDGNAPYYPTPNPPDDTVSVDYIRYSTLPIENIEAAVEQQTDVNAWIDWNGSPGSYLCNYIAYLGMWYQNMHNATDDEFPCPAAGFIHVAANTSIEDATEAAEITIRETIYSLLDDDDSDSESDDDGGGCFIVGLIW